MLGIVLETNIVFYGSARFGFLLEMNSNVFRSETMFSFGYPIFFFDVSVALSHKTPRILFV